MSCHPNSSAATNLYLRRTQPPTLRTRFSPHFSHVRVSSLGLREQHPRVCKGIYCLVYQTTPDGLIFHLFVPIEGRQPDEYLYHKSDLESKLRENLNINRKRYCIYGDQDYVLRPWMQTVYPPVFTTAEQLSYKASLSATRI